MSLSTKKSSPAIILCWYQWFLGQLPQPYDNTDVGESTRVARNTFNDQNQPNENRFVKDPIKDCDYIVDQVVHVDDQTELEPDFKIKNPTVWEEQFSIEFLDAKRSPQIFRAFYIPFLSRGRCTFNNYTLYKNINPKSSQRTMKTRRAKQKSSQNRHNEIWASDKY